MPVVKDKYRGSVKYHLVFCELIRAARYGGLTTYQAIAQLMGLPLKGSHMGKEVGQILGEIAEDEMKQGRPMLSAVAVGVSGSPGPGYYSLARQLGKLESESDEDAPDFWQQELDEVYAVWSRKYKT